MTKTYDELTFTDDFMFCKVLENNEDICRKIIELVVGRKIAKVGSLQKQKSIELTPDGKGIRLDVIFEGDDKIYNIEMQNMPKDDLPRRVRYYQGLLDLDVMERGKKYKDLKDTTIIFICTFDPFGAGKSIYNVRQIIEEMPEFQYNDGTSKIFLSAKEPLSKGLTGEMKDFLDFVGGRSDSGILPGRIRQAMEKVKGQVEWRKEYMLLQEKIDEASEIAEKKGEKKGRAEGEKIGRAEGEKIGEKKGVAKSIMQMKKNNMTISQIAQIMEMSEAEIEELLTEE